MTLDDAWNDVLAALPDGWFLGSLTNHAYRKTDTEPWMAQAYEGPELDANYRTFRAGFGDTPAAALGNLAWKLREETPR